MTTRLVAVTLCLLLAAPSFTIAQSPTGNCSTIARDFNRGVDRFQAEARNQGLTMLVDEAVDAVTDDFEELMQQNPATAVAMDINGKWNELTEFSERVDVTGKDLSMLKGCLNTSSCDVERLNSRLNQETRTWVGNLGDGSLSKVADRVGKASDFLQTQFQSTFSLTTGIMSRMNGCLTPFRNAQPKVRVVNAETPNVAAVEEPAPVPDPTAKPVDPAVAADPKNGGTGKTLALVGVAGAAAYGASALGLFGSQCAAEAPNNYHSVCESQGRNTSSCLTLQDEYREWCSCQGRNFSYSGGCTSGSR